MFKKCHQTETSSFAPMAMPEPARVALLCPPSLCPAFFHPPRAIRGLPDPKTKMGFFAVHHSTKGPVLPSQTPREGQRGCASGGRISWCILCFFHRTCRRLTYAGMTSRQEASWLTRRRQQSMWQGREWPPSRGPMLLGINARRKRIC